MNYPAYRKQDLPLTSSLMECLVRLQVRDRQHEIRTPLSCSIIARLRQRKSAIEQINIRMIRMKGSEKFCGKSTGETLLQLRADSLSDSNPLRKFWHHWRSHQTGTTTYRKQVS